MKDDDLPENLLKGCRKRDRKSQKELYKLYYGYGMSITLRYASSREDAVTILNDTFLKVFEKLHTYDSQHPFKPWFRKILINTSVNQYHKNRSEPVWQQLETEFLADNPSEAIISGITSQEILAMVQQLPPAYRTVFNLYVMEGYTHKEISELLNIHEGTSKSNLFKAKRELRLLLEKKLYT